MTLPLRPDDPEQIGRYRVVGRLGEGGQGIVYLAETDAAISNQVAVKVLRAGPTDSRARRRFAREVQILQRLNEKSTAPILDFNLDVDRPYLVSAYVPGPSLEERRRRDGPLDPVELASLAVRTVAALRVVHRQEITHRDIKPRNILLGPDRPRIIDFGVAKVLSGTDTQTREIFATPPYMSPEQRRGDLVVSARSDIYSWALSILFAAGGYDPDSGKRDLDKVDDPLRTLLGDCLAEDSAARPSAELLYQRMANAGMIRVHGMPEDLDPDEAPTVNAMPTGSTAPDPTRNLPAPSSNGHFPILASGAVTVATTSLAFLVLNAGAEKLIPAALGLFVIVLVLASICSDPAYQSGVRREPGRPRTPTPPPPE